MRSGGRAPSSTAGTTGCSTGPRRAGRRGAARDGNRNPQNSSATVETISASTGPVELTVGLVFGGNSENSENSLTLHCAPAWSENKERRAHRHRSRQGRFTYLRTRAARYPAHAAAARREPGTGAGHSAGFQYGGDQRRWVRHISPRLGSCTWWNYGRRRRNESCPAVHHRSQYRGVHAPERRAEPEAGAGHGQSGSRSDPPGQFRNSRYAVGRAEHSQGSVRNHLGRGRQQDVFGCGRALSRREGEVLGRVEGHQEYCWSRTLLCFIYLFPGRER